MSFNPEKVSLMAFAVLFKILSTHCDVLVQPPLFPLEESKNKRWLALHLEPKNSTSEHVIVEVYSTHSKARNIDNKTSSLYLILYQESNQFVRGGAWMQKQKKVLH